MELSPSLEKFAKDVFRKSKASKRSIDQDFKECAELVQYNQSIGTSFWEDYSKLQTARIKNQAMHRFNAYFPARNTSGCPKGTVRSCFTPEDMPMLNLLWGQKDLSSCYEILKSIPGGEFSRD